jgi:hypothetical protein
MPPPDGQANGWRNLWGLSGGRLARTCAFAGAQCPLGAFGGAKNILRASGAIVCAACVPIHPKLPKLGHAHPNW